MTDSWPASRPAHDAYIHRCPTNGTTVPFIQTMTMPPYPPILAQDREQPPTLVEDEENGAPTMGPLELATYRDRWRASARFRLHTAKLEADRKRDRLIRDTEEKARAVAEQAMREKGLEPPRRKSGTADRHREDDEDEDKPAAWKRSAGAAPYAVGAGHVAAGLLFARTIDARPGLYDACRERVPRSCARVRETPRLRRTKALRDS
jgi:hypothetical protein